MTVSPESELRKDWPSFVPNWNEHFGVNNFKKTTKEYELSGRLYRASLDFTGFISLKDDTLTIDAFDVDFVVEVGTVCKSELDLKATLDSWQPRDPSSKYPDETLPKKHISTPSLVMSFGALISVLSEAHDMKQCLQVVTSLRLPRSMISKSHIISASPWSVM